MALFPVIMCGGAGTRLWPASRPTRPKQFIALAGNRSLFQDTVERVAELALDGGRLLIVGGAAHADVIADQLAEIGVEAQVLLEPAARDSAAAMAAAAAWIQRRDPEGIAAFVASDHYVTDPAAFRQAVKACREPARAGRIVTLGVKPTLPSPAYGYIRPAGPGLSPVLSFHEKPERAMASRFIADGYLWNSGNFIVKAAVLMDELETHAPTVKAAAIAALPPPTTHPTTQHLGKVFTSAPRISIDYAVMEQTDKASVLAIDFDWSDLGSWDAIADSGEGSTGVHILQDSERVLTRAPDGVVVAALGVSDLAIVVEPDAVLVCNIERSQEVKGLVERIGAISPRHLDFTPPLPENLGSGARWMADWLRLRALPLWATLGFDTEGGFRESITLSGHATIGWRRSRVQTRQIYVYCQAGLLGWQGPWKSLVTSALSRLRQSYLRDDGASRALLANDFTPINDDASLYDQAFVLFGLAAAKRAGIEDPGIEEAAVKLRELLVGGSGANGAMREIGPHPYQSNAHMHIFEAALAWMDISDDDGWRRLSESMGKLALTTFIDAERGVLREIFSADWTPADGEAGRLVEPGHQFEWAWLLTRYGRAFGDRKALDAAKTLYAIGLRGVTHRPPIVIDEINDDLTLRSRRARLWPQGEWLKAALILAEDAVDNERQSLLDDAATALRALKLYLSENGAWHDKRLPSGAFIDEPAPATSLYHIMMAYEQLYATGHTLELPFAKALKLD